MRVSAAAPLSGKATRIPAEARAGEFQRKPRRFRFHVGLTGKQQSQDLGTRKDQLAADESKWSKEFIEAFKEKMASHQAGILAGVDKVQQNL